MTNEEKKAWLNRYQLLEQKNQRLQEEIVQWEVRASPLTVRYGIVPTGGSVDALQRAVEEMQALRDDLEEQLQKQETIRCEIEAAIQRIEDRRLRECLRCRYLKGWIWEGVAVWMGYSPSYTARLHRQALEKLTFTLRQ